jgi:enamine deaminase RidA (YjgF/YER057c/UK114 family)
MTAEVAAPLARYAPFRRAGDLVFFAGIVAADPARGIVIRGYADLPADSANAPAKPARCRSIPKTVRLPLNPGTSWSSCVKP